MKWTSRLWNKNSERWYFVMSWGEPAKCTKNLEQVIHNVIQHGIKSVILYLAYKLIYIRHFLFSSIPTNLLRLYVTHVDLI